MNFQLTRPKTLARFGLGVLALSAVLTAGTVTGVFAQGARQPVQVATTLQLTPAFADNDEVTLTPAQTEGPYFKPNSPERTSLIDETVTGTRLVITGRVLAADGTPVANALLDFWQASDSGNYDNQGYELRGHQYTNADGYYTLETVVPGLYTGRTRHIHVKVQAPNAPVLTTQLYFPDEPQNARDSIFNAALLLPIQQTDTGETAAFDFVVQTA
ncbi:MAG TPA: intradiol ring-cleavage dioxygenase [Chloroflexota bacterium]|jgi:protocatechuate 3,4-dioxygenase beta subunit